MTSIQKMNFKTINSNKFNEQIAEKIVCPLFGDEDGQLVYDNDHLAHVLHVQALWIMDNELNVEINKPIIIHD